MEKKYVRLNIDDNHLSFGNLLRIIKKHANIKNAALQIELFCILFDCNTINETTVNNYCTGYRPIADAYKQKYIFLQKSYAKDSSVFNEIFANLLINIQGIAQTFDQNIENTFNSSSQIKSICYDLFNIAKNEKNLESNKITTLNDYLIDNNYYNFFAEILFFVIIDKKQPLYEKDNYINTIDNLINNTYLSNNDVNDFLSANLTSGIFSIRALTELAKKDNPVACFQLGSLELKGLVTGKRRENIAYKYFEKAAKKNHPSAYWVLGILNYRANANSKPNYNLAWEYFNKSESLGCIAASNNIGLMYLESNAPDSKNNIEKALEYFNKAATHDYAFAYNNLGLIAEKKQDYKIALQYYKLSAKQGESWAANHVGEYYRLGRGTKKDMKNAFKYYKIATETVEAESTPWAFYNLAKYFYENGCKEIGMEADQVIANKYYKTAKKIELEQKKDSIF